MIFSDGVIEPDVLHLLYELFPPTFKRDFSSLPVDETFLGIFNNVHKKERLTELQLLNKYE